MRRYLSFWAELLRLSWRMVPGLTALMFTVLTVNVALTPAVALALRYTVNASLRGDARQAVTGAIAAAVSYGLASVAIGTAGNLRVLLVEKVGMTELHERIQVEIATIDGLEHLENPEFLDRVTVVGTAAWQLTDGMWAAVGSVFNVLQLAVSLLVLGQVSPWLLGLLGFAAVPLWFDQRGQRAVRVAETASAEQYRLQGQLFDLATSVVAGKEIRVAGTGERLALLQERAWATATEMRIRARLAAAAWQLAGWSLFTAAFAAGLWLVVNQDRRGHGSVGDIVLTVTIATTLHSSVQQTVRRAADSAYAGRLIEPYLWLRDYAAAARLRSRSARPPARLTSGIDLCDVSYTYPGTASPALDGITARIPAGTVVAVVGEYGSGKTTLAKLLAKFYQPQHGTIRVDGTDLAELGTAEWRTSMASAFQDFGRYHVTAAEAVGLGDPGHLNDTRRIDAAIAQADARILVDRMPHGLETQLGKELGGIQLSEGQWQKIALARASMRPQPLLFILDEPTASLDAPSEHAVHELYMARARATAAATGAITLIISHRFSTVTGADHILVLNDGKLEDAGTHAELMARGGRYAEMYSIQETAYARQPAEATRDQTD